MSESLWHSRLSRRRLLAWAGLSGAGGLLAVCGKNPLLPDITKDEAAEYVRGAYPRLLETAHTPGREMRIEIGGDYLGKIRFQPAGGNFRFLHPVITMPDDQDVHMVFGIEYEDLAPFPSIRLTDRNGNTLERNGKKMKFSIRESSLPKSVRRALAKRIKAGSFDSWLELGIALAAIGLAAFLGLKVIGFAVAVLAFLAFNAMVIGLVIAAFAIADDVVRFLVNAIEKFTGVDLGEGTFDNIREFFEQAIEKIREFLDTITDLQI